MAEVTLTYTAEITRVFRNDQDRIDELVEFLRAPGYAKTLGDTMRITSGYDDVEVRDVKVFFSKEDTPNE